MLLRISPKEPRKEVIKEFLELPRKEVLTQGVPIRRMSCSSLGEGAYKIENAPNEALLKPTEGRSVGNG